VTFSIRHALAGERVLPGRPLDRREGDATQPNDLLLSRALVLIEAAQRAAHLRQVKRPGNGPPLFTADYSAQEESNDGNRILLERGACAYAKSCDRKGEPNPTPQLARREPIVTVQDETYSGFRTTDLFPR